MATKSREVEITGGLVVVVVVVLEFELVSPATLGLGVVVVVLLLPVKFPPSEAPEDTISTLTSIATE